MPEPGNVTFKTITIDNNQSSLKLPETDAPKIPLEQIKTNSVLYAHFSDGTERELKLSDYIPETERIITIEDNAELQITELPNLVRLEARNANVEGTGEISIRDLIRTALRMRPDRIIVGEVRGKEAADMLQAFNTGHDGSLSTGHANSPKDMLSRLEMMTLMGMDIPLSAVQRQIAAGIDIMVHLGRLRDRSRKVLEIVEVLGYEKDEIRLQSLFSFRETGEKNGKIQGEWVKNADLLRREKLLAAGY